LVQEAQEAQTALTQYLAQLHLLAEVVGVQQVEQVLRVVLVVAAVLMAVQTLMLAVLEHQVKVMLAEMDKDNQCTLQLEAAAAQGLLAVMRRLQFQATAALV
jgi:hypothetical protein